MRISPRNLTEPELRFMRTPPWRPRPNESFVGRHDDSSEGKQQVQLSFSLGFSTIQSSRSLQAELPVDKLRVLITREQIAAKVAQMGERITADFAGESLVLIGVLKGGTIFLAD